MPGGTRLVRKVLRQGTPFTARFRGRSAISANQLHRGDWVTEEEHRKVRVSGGVRPKSAVGARAVADREAFQMSGHSFQLSQRNQAVLHAVERRQKNRYRDGPAGSGNWRDCRGKPARGTAGDPGSEHATVQDGPEGLQVVSRSASLRDSAALRFWAWLRAHADVCDRRLKYS